MKIPIISNLLQREGRRRIRRVMRGYRFLKKSGNLGRISAVKAELTNTKIEKCGSSNSKLIFGVGLNESELITRQYLLSRVGGLGLNKALLSTVGKSGSSVVYPMPSEWREVLRQHGFEVDGLLSATAWYFLNFTMFVKGIVTIARLFFDSMKAIIRPSFHPLEKYAYFVDLTAGNLPHPVQDGRSYDVISWYQQWAGRFDDLDTLCHSVKGVAPATVEGKPVVSVPAHVPPLTHFGALISLLLWGVAATARAIIDLCHNRWWHAFMLMEAAKAAQVRLQSPHRLARVYLFHLSNHIYRPLWTYEAAMSGSQITCYFYSINFEPFKRLGGYPPIPYGFHAMNWPHYLAWDEYQASFVRSAVGLTPRIDIVGPIPFNGGVKVPHDFPAGVIAVFDVQPMRDAFYQTLGFDFEYYVPKNSNKFMTDIQQATAMTARFMAYKPKRKIGRLLHPSYEGTIKYLSKLSNVLEIDADTSAHALIAHCAAVVSAPFTSPAIIGRELGKPSVYYDPYGICEKDDRAAHAIPILSGKTELKEWLSSLNL